MDFFLPDRLGRIKPLCCMFLTVRHFPSLFFCYVILNTKMYSHTLLAPGTWGALQAKPYECTVGLLQRGTRRG